MSYKVNTSPTSTVCANCFASRLFSGSVSAFLLRSYACHTCQSAFQWHSSNRSLFGTLAQKASSLAQRSSRSASICSKLASASLNASRASLSCCRNSSTFALASSLEPLESLPSIFLKLESTSFIRSASSEASSLFYVFNSLGNG